MKSNPRVHWLKARQGDGFRVPSVAFCSWTIAQIRVALKVIGVGRTLRWIRARIEAVPLVTTVSIEDLRACEYSVAMAAAFFPGRAECLERSLAFFYLARRLGIPVTYHHGVQPVPFKAHAWVEFDGQIVNDVPEHVQLFDRLPQVCP